MGFFNFGKNRQTASPLPATSNANTDCTLREQADRYYEGNGVVEDRAKALQLYEQLASRGNAFAQWRCATIYTDGDYVPADEQRANYWYTEAAKQGHDVSRRVFAAKKSLYQMIEKNGSDIAHDFIRACLTFGAKAIDNGNYDEAFNFYVLPAMYGSIDAQYNCGLLLLEALSPTDPYAALYYYELAAKQGLVKAQNQCAIMYNSGRGASSNSEKALYWYSQAADQGDAEAQILCGGLYLSRDDNGCFKSLPNAKKYLMMAANQDNDSVREDALKMLQLIQNYEDDIRS